MDVRKMMQCLHPAERDEVRERCEDGCVGNKLLYLERHDCEYFLVLFMKLVSYGGYHV